MLLVYNYVLLKMSTWCSKHVEESNILRINNSQCIKLVINVLSYWIVFIYDSFWVPGSSVGKATCYGINVSGFKPRCEQEIVGHLFITFGFTKQSLAPWRLGLSWSLKRWGTLTHWRGCLTENNWLNSMSLLHTRPGRCGPPHSSFLHNGYRR